MSSEALGGMFLGTIAMINSGRDILAEELGIKDSDSIEAFQAWWRLTDNQKASYFEKVRIKFGVK